jgi:hypothetical protein
MDSTSIKPLLNSWTIICPGFYVIASVSFALFVRLILAILKGTEHDIDGSFRKDFFGAMTGFSGPPTSKDYLYPFYLGCFEFLAFPVFIHTSNWALIGAWITLKVAPQWKHWGEHRPAFNRFLLGTAFVLGGSFFLAAKFISKA